MDHTNSTLETSAITSPSGKDGKHYVQLAMSDPGKIMVAGYIALGAILIAALAGIAATQAEELQRGFAVLLKCCLLAAVTLQIAFICACEANAAEAQGRTKARNRWGGCAILVAMLTLLLMYFGLFIVAGTATKSEFSAAVIKALTSKLFDL